jgi:hypothetical protein
MGPGTGQARSRVKDPAAGTEYLRLEDLLDLVNQLGAGPVRSRMGGPGALSSRNTQALLNHRPGRRSSKPLPHQALKVRGHGP